jgi:hypothetical protein
LSLEKTAVLAFFICLLLVGLSAYNDYGTGWDEPLRYEAGSVVFGYLASGKSVPARVTDDHGLVFELFLAGIQRLSSLHDSRDIYLQRHIVSHLFFLLGVFGFYLLIKRHLRSDYLALLGAGMLVLSPRIYAHSFFNTKDIPFMVMIIFCLYSFARAFEARSARWFIIHGVFCGLLASIRIIGIILLVFTLAFIMVDYLFNPGSKKLLALSLPYLSVFIVTLIGTWPFLWSDPVRRFAIALRSLSSYPWQGKVLYFGRYYKGTALPWHYAPVWLAITTPIPYSAAFLVGCGWSARDLARNLKASFTDPFMRNTLLFLLCFFTPLGAVIARHSVLYDGWRHLYFIYPCFLLLAITGIAKITSALKNRKAIYLGLLWGILAFSMASAGFFMLRSHPYQYVYFNILLPRKDEYLRKNWELDYWGVSYRQALEHILSIDPRDNIKVAANTDPGKENTMILEVGARERLEFVDDPQASDYFITNYRWHPEDYAVGSEIYSVRVQGSRIMSVYKVAK